MEVKETKGASFLKVTGILMIIGGALSLLFAIIALLGVAAVAALSVDVEMGLLYLASGVSLVGGVLELIAGIVGVKNCRKPEKATACIVWGAIVAALSIISNVATVIGGGTFSWYSLALGLVLPVLYIIGAIKNKAA